MATNMLKKQKKHTEKMNNLILIREWKINLFHTTLNSHYSCRTIRKLNRACKLLKFVSMVSMFLTISGDKQNNCCNGA